MISLRTHNIIDYILGVFLVIAPYLFGFAQAGTAANVFMVVGTTLIVYSLLTNYYYSLARVIPLGLHMTLDALTGLFLILAPALFGYRELLTNGQYALHIFAGIGVTSLVLMTKTRSEEAKTPTEKIGIEHETPLLR